MNIGDVFLTVRANLSQFQADLAKLNSQVSRSATDMGKSLSNIGKGLQSTGRGLTTNLTLPILAAGGAVTHFALDFDTTMRKIVGLAKVPAGEIAGVRDEILKMGEEIGRSPQDLAEAFYFVASAGFEANEAMEVLRISATASAAGMGEVQDVAKTLGGVINAYGKENLSAAHAGDILTAAIQDGAAEASDFAGVIGFVVPVAASLGVSFDQVAAALSAMTQVGISADTAATNLGQVMAALQKPTVEAEKAMEGLGLSSAGLRTELKEKGLLATLRTLEERFAGNEQAASLVFGNIRALRGVTALLGLDTAQLNGIFADTAGALDTLSGAYEDTDGPQRRLDKAMASLQATAIELGADVLPMVVDVLDQVADTLRGVGRWWRSLDEGTRKNIVQWLAWTATIGPVLLVMGKLVSGLGAIFKAVGFLLGAKGLPAIIGKMGGLRAAMLGTVGPVGAIAAAFVGLKVASGFLDDFFDSVTQGGKAHKELKSLEALVGDRGLAGRLRELGISAKDMARLIEAAGGDVGYAISALNDSAGDLGKAFTQLWADSDAAAEGLFEGWGPRGPAAEAALEAARNAKAIPENVAAELVDGEFVIRDAAEDALSPIDEAMEKARQAAADEVRGLISDLQNILAGGPEEITDEVQAIVDAVVDPFTRSERALILAGELGKAGFREGFTSDDPKLEADTFATAMDLLAQFDLLKPGMFDIGAEVPVQYQEGVRSSMGAALTYFQSLHPDLTNPFDVAEELDRLGYHALASYARGVASAAILHVNPAAEQMQRDLHYRLDKSYYGDGYRVALSYAAGLEGGGWRVNQAGEYLQSTVGGHLEFQGSPPYTHSREIGTKVGLTWGQGIIASLRDLIPSLASTVGSVASTLSAQPMGLATAGLASFGTPAAIPTTVGTGPSTVNNTWNLTVNGVPYTFNNRDDFIKALDDLSAFGDGRISGG